MSARRDPARTNEVARIPRGRRLAREDVLRSQRIRLRLAMITAVAESGYQATGIRDLARLAGVSPNVVYEFYANKEECFLDTHDVISKAAIGRLTEAADISGEDWHERMHAGVRAFIEAVTENPAAASLAILETHAVGARALEHQQHALDEHAGVIRRGLERAPHGAEVSDTTIQGLVAGIRSVVYHSLNSRHPQRLSTLVDPIYEWMACYVSPAGAALPPAPPLSRGPRARLPRVSTRRAASKAAGSGHRERITRAVAAIACEQGYAGLSMPAITQRARVSNQTFYEHFRDKHEAFLACYDRVSRRAFGATLASLQAADGWPAAIRAALETMLGLIVTEPEFARLAFFEILAAGPDARRRADGRMESYSALLDPGYELSETPPPRIVGALVLGATLGVIQQHILRGQSDRLLELAPHLTYLVLTPFIGAELAAATATA